MSYVITSDNVVGHKNGDQVDSFPDGVNVAALIAGGHVREVKKAAKVDKPATTTAKPRPAAVKEDDAK